MCFRTSYFILVEAKTGESLEWIMTEHFLTEGEAEERLGQLQGYFVEPRYSFTLFAPDVYGHNMIYKRHDNHKEGSFPRLFDKMPPMPKGCHALEECG